MAYTSSIPAATDSPSQSQPLLLANFQQIATAFNTNHGDFNSGEEGLHTFLQMPEQSSAPTTAANVGALYTKEVSGTTQLFWREESDGTEYQMTGQQTLSGGQGSITLPGGLIFKYGTCTAGSTLTFTTPFPTAIYSVQMTGNGVIGTPFPGTPSASVTGFGVQISGGSAGNSIFFLAIGM